MKYKVDLSQTVIESTTLYIEAHNKEQAELIAEYIAQNGKDPWDRKFVEVFWRYGEIQSEAEVISCEERETADPCNTVPEHTEGLWAA
jgi:hypothetical protein